MKEPLKEFDVWTADQKEIVDIINGYGKADALRRHPEYDSDRYLIIGGWIID